MAEELRSYAWHCLRSSSHLQTSQKLALLRRFLLAFSKFGDVESQLVLQYEILCLCELNGATGSDIGAADIKDWISFAEDCLAAGFPSNAAKAYEKVVAHLHSCQQTYSQQDLAVRRISKHLQHRARADITDMTMGVRGQTSNCLDSECEKSRTSISRFMAGIRKREKAKLQKLYTRNK